MKIPSPLRREMAVNKYQQEMIDIGINKLDAFLLRQITAAFEIGYIRACSAMLEINANEPLHHDIIE